MATPSAHGNGVRTVDPSIRDRAALCWHGGSAELISRRVSTTDEIRLSASRHAVFFKFDLPPIRTEIYFDARLQWRGVHQGAQMSVVPAEGEMIARPGNSGEATYLALFLEPGFLRTTTGSPDIALRPTWSDGDALSWHLAQALRAECSAGAPGGLLYTETAAAMLALQLQRLYSNQGRKKPAVAEGGLAPYQLRRVTDHIADHAEDDLSLGELATIAGLSPHHFCRAFKRSTGLPPHRWQIQLRLKRAKALMLATDRKLADIASAVGFADQSHFTTMFRKDTGTTPAAWRRKLRA